MGLKKIGGLLLVGFFVFFIVQSPREAADVVRITGQSLGEVFSAAANAFSDFLTDLF
ncbi:MAG: hypothetical protein ACRDK3_13765 [Actinomycetota bacterium]